MRVRQLVMRPRIFGRGVRVMSLSKGCTGSMGDGDFGCLASACEDVSSKTVEV
jgi:hypothetical protein